VFKRIFSISFAIFLVAIILSPEARAFSQDYTPIDPGRVYQQYFDLINIEPSWSNELRMNKQVVVAVLDSGVDLDHPDLVNNIWNNPAEIANNGIDDDFNSYVDDTSGWDFIDSDNIPEPVVSGSYDRVAANHGTVISGVIAAARNGSGIIGVAPQAKIMPLRILDSRGQGNTLVLSQAIDYAVENGADIINLSLVGSSYDESLRLAVKNAYDNGVMIVAASGNEEDMGIDLDTSPRYPVCEMDEVNRVLGVSAVDSERALTDFSNFGYNCIDVSAPGTNFYSTVFNQLANPEFTEYYTSGWSGTSVAAPVISATAALIKMHYPQFRPFDIYNIITASTSSLRADNPQKYLELGTGLIDVGAALNLASSRHDQSRRILLAANKGAAPFLTIFDEDGEQLDTWLAYGEGFLGGFNIATGDVNGDSIKEIITAPKTGGGPHIRIFDESGNVLSEFMAYDPKFYGGVNVSVGDIDGDGQTEIITAPLSNGGPHIRVFDWRGNLQQQFFAYEDNYFGGVNIAAGDVNNDGRDEIITAPANAKSSEIKVFDHYRRIKGRFLAYDAGMTDGVNVTVGDVNNDGWQEIITVPAKNQTTHVKMFSTKGRLKGEFAAYTSQLRSGAEIVARDLSGDGQPEILTIPHRGSAALLKVYDSRGLEKDSFYLRDVSDKNGYQLEVLAY
jgi:subtilisin family serine protease